MSTEDPRFLKVEGHSYLVRDTMSNAIINQNTTEFNNYKNQKQKRDIQKNRIDQIESDVSEIKSLLKQLLDKD
jgi:hypothetical protein|tara:strand:- start:3397 stop:3615 length:219 start_codon:yes stop_codon:yes gene_type:complete